MPNINQMYNQKSIMEQTMTKKGVLFGILIMMILFGMIIIGCDNGTPNNGTLVPQEAINAKWEIDGGNSRYSSFEFTSDNVYIVIENVNWTPMNIQSSGGMFGYNQNIIRSSGERTVSPSESNLSPIHTGQYSINGNEITLAGFGLLNIVSLTTEEFIFSFTLENSNETFEYNASKIEDAAAGSSRTNMLCHFWKFDKVSPEPYDMNAVEVLISKAGTYLVIYNDGSAGLAEWKWANSEETRVRYSWDNWRSSSEIRIPELTPTKLTVLEHGYTYELVRKY
jgi:hypothetical protein